MVSHLHSKPHSKFGGYGPCGRSITDPIFHVTLQDHVIEGPCDFREGTSPLYTLTMQSSVAIGIVVVDV